MLETLSRAVSPRAVDLLLDQPARWAAQGLPAPPLDTPSTSPELSRVLDRLVVPPLVVAIGPSNVGKSTLLNRLAGRPVAVTADEPGTTRDHVGSLVDLDGLIVRYVDTPGLQARRDGA
ncbi:MAG: GTP-binding protein [Planctomycetota bacterium]|nr:MAG: GTP-binding protein [Planctomycetota bacterium]